MSSWTRVARCWWILPVGLFGALRLFGDSPIYPVRSDQCSYLALAKSFPFHRLYNGELYLIHPPLWGWIVGVFHLALPLVWAGLAATQILAAASLAAAILWGRRNRLGHAAMAVAILFLAVQTVAIAWDSQVSRFPILVFITTLAFVVFERWMQKIDASLPGTPGDATAGFPWLALLVNTLAFLISDQCLMILPCQAAIFALGGRWRRWKAMAGLMALSAAAFLIWPTVRLGVYLTHDSYPAGINGTIEDVRNAPIKAIFQPNLLPRTLEHNTSYTAGEFRWSNLHWRNLRPLWRIVGPWPDGLHWIAAALIGLAFLRSLRIRAGNVALDWPDLAINLKLLLIAALLYLPAAAGLYPWYAMAALVPFALLLGRGVDAFRLLWPRGDLPIAWAIALMSVPVAGWWLSGPRPIDLLAPWSDVRQGGSNFLYSRQPMYRARKLADRINRLPADGGAILAELSMELTVLTDRRVFDLPFDPAELWPIIQQYDVRYIVVDDHAFARSRTLGLKARKAVRGDTFRAIMDDPERFLRIHQITDDYAGEQRPDSFTIYQVVRP